MSIFSRFTKPLIPQPAAAPGGSVIAVEDRPDGSGRQYRLDTIGQVCPFPLVEAKQAIKGLDVGDELIIDFDCTQGTDSIPHWAAAAGYPVTNFEQVGDATWTITVQKA
jgi:TusA-related sulfurtransferase